jgi:porphobilinogen synthase
MLHRPTAIDKTQKIIHSIAMQSAPYPLCRPRRLRASAFIRELTQETRLHPSDFILPLFVQEGSESTPIVSLPDVSRLSIPALVEHAKQAHSLGIQAIALFPATPQARKTDDGKEALNPDNLVCRAIKALKNAVPNLGIIADVALDPYTTHGHDGVLDSHGYVANDATIDILAQQAIVLAKAGADIVAPSDMMDGRVGAIRMALEMEGFFNTLILAYSAKYASAFYGPFRDAVGSTIRPETSRPNEPSAREAAPHVSNSMLRSGGINKSTYQMHPTNAQEALKEAAMDVAEGADMLMVKPALPYLDIIATLKKEFTLPVLAYQVSGEYAMIKHAAAAGAFDERAAMLEALTSIKRAGASAILTYAAMEVAKSI